MKRRQTLSILGGAGLTILAGCLQDGAASGGDGHSSAVDVAKFEVTGTGPNQDGQRADVSTTDDIRIEGTITGNNGCYVAELADTSYDGSVLEVTVEAVEDDDGQMCTQALTDIDYEATFTVEGAPPTRIVVKHDSMGEIQTVTEFDV